MLLSPRKNGLTSLFKEVRVFKVGGRCVWCGGREVFGRVILGPQFCGGWGDSTVRGAECESARAPEIPGDPGMEEQTLSANVFCYESSFLHSGSPENSLSFLKIWSDLMIYIHFDGLTS